LEACVFDVENKELKLEQEATRSIPNLDAKHNVKIQEKHQHHGFGNH
jgi:hypothetical protein